jgi:hypothetical protein
VTRAYRDDRYTIDLPIVKFPKDKLAHDMVPLTRDSGIKLQKAVEQLGRYFRREFQYDFMPFEAGCMRGDFRGFLFPILNEFVGRDHVRIGGVAMFEWQTKEDVQDPAYGERWWLMWAWFHPYQREKGHLTRAWRHFQSEFQDFHIQRPLSSAMRHFLEKTDPEKLLAQEHPLATQRLLA